MKATARVVQGNRTVLYLVEPVTVRGYRRCFVAVIPAQSRNSYVAYAQCSPLDQFDAGFGLKLARNRAEAMSRTDSYVNDQSLIVRVPKDVSGNRKQTVSWLQETLKKRGLFRGKTSFVDSEAWKIERTYKRCTRIMRQLACTTLGHLQYRNGMGEKHRKMLAKLQNTAHRFLAMRYRFGSCLD